MRRLLTIATFGCSLALAQDSPNTGTNVGQVLPGPFRAYVVAPQPKVDDAGTQTTAQMNYADAARVNKPHDLITRFGLDPVCAVIVRDPVPTSEVPLTKLLQDLDKAVDQYKANRFRAFCVFLTLQGEVVNDEGAPAQIAAVKDIAATYKIERVPLALDQRQTARSLAFDFPLDSSIVVLVYDKQVVKARFVYTAENGLDESGSNAILAAIKKTVTGK